MRSLALVLTLASLMATPWPCSAQDEAAPEDLQAAPADDVSRAALPFFVSLGLGTSIRLDGTVAAQLRIQEELGMHLDGTTTGPFAAIVLAEDFLAIYSMQIGIRVGWDLPLISRDFAILAQVSILIPFAFDVGPADSSYAYFSPQVAAGVSLLLLEGLLSLWIRPIVFDIYIGENVHGAYAGLAGAAINFAP